MRTDCEKLSLNALEIFKRLEPFFPPDPWKRPMWKEEGTVEDNGVYDLRKSEDRARLIDGTVKTLGSFVQITASVYKGKNGSFDGFEIEHFGPMIRNKVELLFILNDLDFQIETGDLVDQ